MRFIRTVRHLLSGRGAAVAFGMSLLLGVFVVAPAEVEAQCSGCVSSGGVQQCGLPSSPFRCQGSTGGQCDDCDNFYATIPSGLTPDGALFTTAATLTAMGDQPSEELVAGVSVLRAACNGAIVARTYTDEAAVRARKATSTLVLQ